MINLSKEEYLKILNFIKENGRKLEYYMIKNFSEDSTTHIIEELKKYQNDDGGFGNALEPDLRLPSSSAVATEFAINIINDLDIDDEDLIRDIIRYLENTYDSKNKYWEIIPEEADNHPRAVWWNYKEIKQFGNLNPTASIAGFLYKHKNKVKTIDVNALVSHIESELLSQKVEEIEAHSLLCIRRFESYLPIERAEKLQEKINETIEHVIELDDKKWENYSPEPIKYITSKNHPLNLKYNKIIEKNLDYLINSRNKNGTWDIKHEWYQYEDVFKTTAKTEWCGFFAYDNLSKLIEFDRLLLSKK